MKQARLLHRPLARKTCSPPPLLHGPAAPACTLLLTIVRAAAPVDVNHHSIEVVERRPAAAGCVHAALRHVRRQVQRFREGQPGGDLAIPPRLRGTQMAGTKGSATFGGQNGAAGKRQAGGSVRAAACAACTSAQPRQAPAPHRKALQADVEVVGSCLDARALVGGHVRLAAVALVPAGGARGQGRQAESTCAPLEPQQHFAAPTITPSSSAAAGTLAAQTATQGAARTAAQRGRPSLIVAIQPLHGRKALQRRLQAGHAGRHLQSERGARLVRAAHVPAAARGQQGASGASERRACKRVGTTCRHPAGPR